MKKTQKNQEKQPKTKKTSQEKQNKEKGKFFQKLGEVLKKRWLVNGTKTIVLVCIIIGIYIGVNILLEKVVLPEIDCTENKIYSLSQETKDKLGKIENDINITLINYDDSSSVINFIERYIELNNHIKLEKINDLSSRTDLMQKYSLEAEDQLIIVQSGENEETLYEYDLYTYDYSTYEQIDTTEEAITNAIVSVITQEKPKVYIMNKHIMYDTDGLTTITESIKKEANEVEELDILAKGEVPADCDCLVITTLREDLTEQEKDKIIAYIKNGGELLLMCGPNITNANLTNFQKVLDEYGVSLSNGVIFEENNANMLSGYPNFIVEELQGASLTQKLNMTTNLCLANATKVNLQEDKKEELGVEYEVLASTSEQAFLRTDLNQSSPTRTKQDGEEEEITVAALVTKTIEEGKESKLIIYGNEIFAMDMPVQLNGYEMYTVNLYNNEDVILNSIAYLNEREDLISIRKNGEDVNYTVTEQQNIIIMIIIFSLPFIIIIAGIIIWIIRRRRK